MDAFHNGLLCIFLLVSQTQAWEFRQSVWREMFTVDVVAPGANFSTAVHSNVGCASYCLQQQDCQAFAFHQHSATCWLYRHLVGYTTTGMASPGTGYFWRLSPSCPGELGYQLEAGICLKIYNSWVNHAVAEARCREDGAHLLIADSAEKIQAVVNRTSARAWLGASDKDREGDWRWLDGSVVQGQFWKAYSPDNWEGKEDLMELLDGRFNDVDAEGTKMTACQIPI